MVKSPPVRHARRRAHEVVLRGARFAGAGYEPAILKRRDQDPVAVLLDRLKSGNGRGQLADSRASSEKKDDVLKLFQPVHRIFHLALLELHCRQPGEPRLDPERIDSAGLVIRRVAADGVTLEGWCEAEGSLRGWVKLGSQESLEDPDPGRRRSRLRAGHPHVDRRLAALAALGTPLAERTSPLFVAPPEVCKAAGSTLLYGVVPLASSELSEAPPVRPQSDEELDEHLSPLLSNATSRFPGDDGFGWLGRDFSSATRGQSRFRPLAQLLGQLAVELDAFGDGPKNRALMALLDRVRLPYGESTQPAGQVLKSAAAVQLEGSSATVRMPDRWPAIELDLRRAIRRQVRALFEARMAAIVPGEGRYGDPDERYRLLAFVRVKRRDGCPPDLLWSAPSAPFTIAAWFESGGVPPVKVALPDVTDRGVLEKLKPDVTFEVPPKIKALLDGIGLDGLLEGKKGSGSGLGIGWRWLCSFSIPIITLCAFLVLSIFLALLNFIFFWLPFVRICLPIPVPKKE